VWTLRLEVGEAGGVKVSRLPLDKSKWFIVHRATGVYTDYGFASKRLALNEAEFLNADAKAAGKSPTYAVVPSYRPPPPPPDLKVIKGGQ
jgi:hypothetical protein